MEFSFGLLTIITFVLSIIFAVLGIGGASIYVPLFYFFGLEIHKAIISGLFLNLVSTFIASKIFFEKQTIKKEDYRYASLILIGIFFGSIFGSGFSFLISVEMIKIILAILLLFSAYKMYLLKEKNSIRFDKIQNYSLGKPIIKFFVGILVGSVAGLVGIGGGIFLVPFLLYQKIEIRKAVAISQFCVLFSSLISLFLHLFYLEKLDINQIIALGAAALFGSYLGVSYLTNEDNKITIFYKMFTLVLILFSLKLIFEVFKLNLF